MDRYPPADPTCRSGGPANQDLYCQLIHVLGGTSPDDWSAKAVVIEGVWIEERYRDGGDGGGFPKTLLPHPEVNWESIFKQLYSI